MRLLLNENLSPRLTASLQDMFPGTTHVEVCGLSAKGDDEIWKYASQQGYVIVSKDSDFYDRSALYGGPPKIIWLRVGNCSTDHIEALLRRSSAAIAALATSPDTTLIIRPRRGRA